MGPFSVGPPGAIKCRIAHVKYKLITRHSLVATKTEIARNGTADTIQSFRSPWTNLPIGSVSPVRVCPVSWTDDGEYADDGGEYRYTLHMYFGGFSFLFFLFLIGDR